ncbi:hypothetical protein ACFE04_011842 [Oxalis oulophora]
MATPDNKLSELADTVKSWISRRTDPVNVSRDFWMPDQSVRVCYECDSQFTVFNRRHHCRLCGRIFCAKCTSNSIPAQSDEPRIASDDSDRIRVCNYCFKLWDQRRTVENGGVHEPTLGLSPSLSATSLASTKSSGTAHSSGSTVGSTPYLTGPYQRLSHTSSLSLSPRHPIPMNSSVTVDEDNAISGMSIKDRNVALPISHNQLCYSVSSVRSDDEDDDYGVYHPDLEARHFSQTDDYYAQDNVDDIDRFYGPHELHTDETLSNSLLPDTSNIEGEYQIKEHDNSGQPYEIQPPDCEPVDFENNGLLWVPPDPEDKEDENEAFLLDDDDDDEGAAGEWGYLNTTNSFDSREYRNRDKSSEEHRKAMKNVVEGHFRALVAQLLQAENLQPSEDEDDKDSWLDIVTYLSWEAATILKPDTSKGGGMDPGGYVKIKCIACGRRSESMVVKGVVCKKNVAHRRMSTRIEKPRFLILGGALEYQRVSNHLSSFDTLLQQEMDHLKMAVTRIDAHHPDVLLVEKSVSRYAQEYLLEKEISLVLNVKRPLLERIARCTGAQIIPSVDHLTSQKLGYCDLFHVDRFFEQYGSAGQNGKKLTKNLMFFEGCPKPLGCTILLKGANGDELKKVKHVLQYGVFAAYHLALETSFLADEGASIPELPLKSPITVALPNKPSSIDRSISTIPGFTVSTPGNCGGPPLMSPLQKANSSIILLRSSSNPFGFGKTEGPEGFSSHTKSTEPETKTIDTSIPSTSSFLAEQVFSGSYRTEENRLLSTEPFEEKIAYTGGNIGNGDILPESHQGALESGSMKELINNTLIEDIGSSKEEFPPSPSDHQSILVSLSTRCVWKGTVCERAHLCRIKYYGSFDKPLGRFLRDHLFDQSYRCRSCDMPSEAHVHCYTHRQGSLTISVKKRPETPLPGEREGKIWMWHRCLRCPRANGFPPATRRVVMSDAAWGLSFGKFLELSFSNHAAASRVASCGHSLHRDCLRFYGFGKMVACFHYASIDVHSVFLPPSKIEFNYDIQDWIEKEVGKVRDRAEVLFTEVHNALYRILEKVPGTVSQDGSVKASESRLQIAEFEVMLQNDKREFEETFQKVVHGNMKAGQPFIDILEINKLRRQLLFHSYVWDQHLINAASLAYNITQEGSSTKFIEKFRNSMEKHVDTNAASKSSKGYSSCDSLPTESKPDLNINKASSHIKQPCGDDKGKDMDQDLHNKGMGELHSCSSLNIINNPGITESAKNVRRAHSEGNFEVIENLSETLDAAWTGENFPMGIKLTETDHSLKNSTLTDSSSKMSPSTESSTVENRTIEENVVSASKGPDNSDSSSSVLSSYSSFSRSFSSNFQKLGISEQNPVYLLSFRELEKQSGARLLLPVGVNDTIVPVYDEEPTSIIAYALVSSEYHTQMSELDRQKDADIQMPLLNSVNLLSLNSFDETLSDTYRSFGSTDENVLSKDLHAKVSFTDDGPLGKVKYMVTCYYAKRFEFLRRMCCPSELDFIRSLSRCKKWGAQGGKSNVFFAKTLDERFIIKQVTKTELESFITFGPEYFKYLSESIRTGSPTCLAKILGIYQVSAKHLKGGKETKMDVLVMENLLFKRNLTRLYDLKGSSRSRYNPDKSGTNNVLLDQNLIEAMPTSPIFVGNKAKRLLERAVWNDTSFLASIDVMDYSLLVGVDEENHELVLGIIDFMRQYTWDKHLETWVKTSGILGNSKNTAPTVISPQQYKKRFRKAMTTYFLMVPDQWSPPTIIPSRSQSDLCEENSQVQEVRASP